MTKCVWAMGLTSKVAVSETVADLDQYQHLGDPFLYPKRWTLGPVTLSEDEFLEECLNNPKSSYALMKRTLRLICMAVVAQGFGSVLAVLWSLYPYTLGNHT